MPPSPPPSAPRPATTGLNGLWEGEFRCGREARTARMMIWREGSHHAASFEFGPTAASPNLAHGALQMRGATTTDGRVRFEPEGTASLAPGDRPIGLLAWVEGPDLRAEVTNRAACAPVSLRKARS